MLPTEDRTFPLFCGMGHASGGRAGVHRAGVREPTNVDKERTPVKSRYVMRGAVCLTATLVLWPCVAPAMNDTDAVVARGLFPLGVGNRALEIRSEEVTVTLGHRGVRAVRTYAVRNRGPERTFAIGTVCAYNDPWATAEDCGTLHVDGGRTALRTGVAYLKDAGTNVEVRRKGREAIAACLKHVDGDVCGHLWAFAEVRFRAGQTRRLEYEAPLVPVEPHRFSYQLTDPLYLYTEKFWAGEEVPRVELRLGMVGRPLSIDDFWPRGEYAVHSRAPDEEEEGFVVWRFAPYRPKKEPYTYKFWVVHPYAIDAQRLCRAYEAISERALCE